MRRGNEFKVYWTEYIQSGDRKILYVLGQGFDPRMCFGYQALLEAGGKGTRDCLLVKFDEGLDSPSTRHSDLVSGNIATLENLLRGTGRLIPKPIKLWSGEGPGRRRIGSRNAAGIFSDMAEFAGYTDIVIDVSAMPRGLYFPLIGKVLYLLDHAKQNNSSSSIPNLHVVVCENAKLDKAIRDIGIDDTASYVYGFGSDLELEATAGIPKVLIAILGERQRGQLERIYNLVIPDEICPVLPSPSSNPRRGDEILVEYRELLFDQWRVEPRNIIYASEQNPFETYRQIHRAVRYYNQVLAPLGGCRVVVSAVSSKLLSVGALLASYELKGTGMSVGLAHVEAQGYDIDKDERGEIADSEEEIFALWLVGDCYEP